MIDAQAQDESNIMRVENKLTRLAEDFRSLSRFGNEGFDEIADSLLELKDVTKEALFDLGQLLLLKVVRIKLHAIRLLSDIKDSEILDDTEATLEEVEEFYKDLERDIALEQERLQQQADVKLIGYIPPFPESEKEDGFDISTVKDKRLFGIIQGFFDDRVEGEIEIEIPQELLELTQTIDIQKLQEEILVRVVTGKNLTVKQLAKGFDFGNDRLAVALVFWVCLFLDFQGKVYLVQSGEDVSVLPILVQTSLS